MWLFDFRIFYLAGRALLVGNSPYLVDGFISPLPLAVFFVPFALLPEFIAYVLYLALSIYLIWRITKKQSLWVLISFPVFITLFVGQIDLLIALSASILGPFALPLLLAKPQLGFVVFPWLIRDSKRQNIVYSFLITLGILMICFWVRPNWILEWLSAIPSVVDYSIHDSNFYWFVPLYVKNFLIWVVSPVALVVGFLIKNRRNSWIILYLCTPISNIYSAAVLAEWIGPIESALSWLVIFLIGGRIHSGAPMFVIGLSLLIRNSSELKNFRKTLLPKVKN